MAPSSLYLEQQNFSGGNPLVSERTDIHIMGDQDHSLIRRQTKQKLPEFGSPAVTEFRLTEKRVDRCSALPLRPDPKGGPFRGSGTTGWKTPCRL